MGWIDRLLGREARDGAGSGDGASATRPGATAAEGAPSLDVHGLAVPDEEGDAARRARAHHRGVGLEGGPTPEETLAYVRGLRHRPEEGPALADLVQVDRERELPSALRFAMATALLERGERRLAELVLEALALPAAQLLLADLLAERGDLSAAIARIERVLVADYDYPGARERHARWREELGLAPTRHRPTASATVIQSEPGTPYELIREVGRGGAAAVYEARDRALGRTVAMKVYHDPDRERAQLLHEGRVASLLAGPGVVPVLDVDPEHGFLVLEWAPGGALRRAIREHDEAILTPTGRWLAPLAAALARIHGAGWVHHDVKPGNILLDRRGAPLLADFGISRRAGEPAPPGSMGYVSPERLAGRASDPRDDIFAVGRVLEDVLAAVSPGARPRALLDLAAQCTGPDAMRPPDGRTLVTRLRIEHGIG